MSSSSSFRESRLYPIVFMIVLSALLTFFLALFYQITKPKVETHKQVSFQTQLLSVFADFDSQLQEDKLNQLDPESIDKLYDKYITEHMYSDSTSGFYSFKQTGKTRGYAFLLNVQGLWSTIELIAALEPDFGRYLGIKIVEQGETPGLGARITEPWFQKQFKGKEFSHKSSLIDLHLIDENSPVRGNQIRQITGATASSRAVMEGVQKKLRAIYQQYFPDIRENL